MAFGTRELVIDVIGQEVHPLSGSSSDFDSLLHLIGDAPVVLIGEASHGTHEFYAARVEITKRLIQEKGFSAVAIEGDWPDAYRVNRYIQCVGTDADATESLSGFQRFPAWMWRNAVVLDFVGWLRAFNDSLPAASRATVGFYGLDLYSLHASMEAVLNYLERVDPTAAERARSRYACFENFGGDPQAYGYAAGLRLSHTCEKEVLEQLLEMHQRAAEFARRDGWVAAEEFFSAEQNARLVKNAEEYYRTMFRGDVSSWNLRDGHMVETFDTLVSHLSRGQHPAKMIIWAHNSHVGDARATQMHRAGELNLGQLLREEYGDRCRSVGFGTYEGTVTAASDWDGPAEVKRVRPGRKDSYEGLFHDIGIPAFLLLLQPPSRASQVLSTPMLERAIGVIYRPESELRSHYFQAQLSKQFDAVIYFEKTRAVEPLETMTENRDSEPAETFPTGI